MRQIDTFTHKFNIICCIWDRKNVPWDHSRRYIFFLYNWELIKFVGFNEGSQSKGENKIMKMVGCCTWENFACTNSTSESFRTNDRSEILKLFFFFLIFGSLYTFKIWLIPEHFCLSGLYPVMQWSQPTLTHKNWLCVIIPYSVFNDITLLAWNQPSWEYLHHRKSANTINQGLVFWGSNILLLNS